MTLLQSLTIIILAFVLALFPESEFIFQSIIFIVTGLSLQFFYRLTRDVTLLKFSNLACFSILFGYIVSTAAYSLINIANYGVVNFKDNVFGLNYQQSTISYSVIIVLLIAIILSALSTFEKPLSFKDSLIESITEKTLVVIIISAFLIIFALINKDLGYMGVYMLSERRVSPLGALCFSMLPPLNVISISFLVYMPADLKKYKKIITLLSAFFILSIIPMGRRVLMYTVLLTLVFIGPYLNQQFIERKIRIIHVIVTVITFLFILFWGFKIFFILRISVNKMAKETKPPITEIIPYTLGLLKSSNAIAEINEKLYENISTRPFVLSYLAGILAAHSYKSTPAFSELVHTIYMSVPSLIQPQKTKKLLPTTEDLIHPILGLSVFDGPNTILTTGLNDLGLMGFLIYPVGVICLYIFIIRIVQKKVPPFIYLFILAGLMYPILYIEAGLGLVIGSGLRDLFIVVIIYLLLLKLPQFFRLKPIK